MFCCCWCNHDKCAESNYSTSFCYSQCIHDERVDRLKKTEVEFINKINKPADIEFDLVKYRIYLTNCNRQIWQTVLLILEKLKYVYLDQLRMSAAMSYLLYAVLVIGLHLQIYFM